MDLTQLLEQLREDGTLTRIIRNPKAQFGLPSRRYIGAELLPESTVIDNAFREDKIAYRTIIANSGSRYSPSQKKGGALVGSFLVELGESDIANEFTSRDYDGLLRHLANNLSMDAMRSFVNFFDTTITRALIELNELQRWQAIVDAQVIRIGDNGYRELVNYPNPAGHRVAAAAAWSTPTTDIIGEIMQQADLLEDKGYTLSRMVAGRNVTTIMANNDTVKERASKITLTPAGQIKAMTGRATLGQINGALADNELPPIERYDLQYRDMGGTARFLPNDVLVMIAETGRDQALDLGDSTAVEIVPNTLGYMAIGRPAGQSDPGRVGRSEAFENKPPRIECEGWQTALPVITEPEAIATIHTIT